MLSFNVLVLVATLYVSFLFGVAFVADRRASQGRQGWLRSPLVYTLSLSIYTTAWTFYGAVGSAVRNGFEFMAIYLGPTLVFVGWWWFLRKLVRIGRTHKITSIADLLSSRYGKSTFLAVIVTLLAVVGSTPYIALQLQSVAFSFSVFAESGSASSHMPDITVTAFWLAVGLVVFTILFGTRNLNASERHHGVVTAIAVEAIVKLVALLAVGIFVVWGIADGFSDTLRRIGEANISMRSATGSRWFTLMFLSASAVICLPRMFQVTVVENSDEDHLVTASWAFPLYLFLMSLFVLPIAVLGLAEMPAGSNPDLFVLTLPIAHNQEALAMLVFLGGFSSATSMVIVAAIALSTMVSNHIITPLWFRLRRPAAEVSGDVRNVLLLSRRLSIAAILALGYGYFRFTGGTVALASIGLIAFTGVAQVLPALVGGIFWRGATRRGAIAGLCAGFFIWGYTLFLPSFEGSWLMSAEFLAQGPFGIEALRPRALFGINELDPLVHALFFSMSINTVLFIVVSLWTFPAPLERLQAAQFVNVFQHSNPQGPWTPVAIATDDLLIMAQRTMGVENALDLFNRAARAQGLSAGLPAATGEFIETLERELAGTVGAATAHAMVGQVAGSASLSVEDLIAVADETAQIMEHSVQLEAQSRELARTAQELQKANEQLTELGAQKDVFLSQISHELRTPMTSIRSFSEILMGDDSLHEEQQKKYSAIILSETVRLTRLLDEILDLSALENRKAELRHEKGLLCDLIDRAISATETTEPGRSIAILREPEGEKTEVETDTDRLCQVFINVVSNARKYCDALSPELLVSIKTAPAEVVIDFADNGSGIAENQREIAFEKFSRLSEASAAGGAGLGLAISREIMRKLGGAIEYVDAPAHTIFRVRVPRV